MLAVLAWAWAGLALANSPTPTPTPQETAGTVTATATPSPTESPSPWVIYVTPTPPPAMGSANIPNNVFHPGMGQPLQLRYSVPLAEEVSISIYDRDGRLMWSRKESVSAGSHVDNWDGSGGSGLVASGIYLVDFEGRNLRKGIKIAVIK